MSVELKTYAGSNVTPQNDAIKDDFNTLSNGIYYGCTVTIKDATTLHITAGQGIVYGRVFEIVDDDISVSLAPSGTLLGQLYLHIDLANLSAPAQLLVETGASLTPMIDDDQININSGITEMQLATFDVSTVTISNLVSTAPNARGAKDIEQTIGNTNISGIGDGTVTGAIAHLNAKLSYSLTEIDTGMKWIDNKTIYRKSFQLTKTSGLALSLLTGVDSIISYTGILKAQAGYNYSIPYTYPNADSGVQVNSNHEMLFISPDNQFGNGTVEICIEYTKI